MEVRNHPNQYELTLVPPFSSMNSSKEISTPRSSSDLTTFREESVAGFSAVMLTLVLAHRLNEGSMEQGLRLAHSEGCNDPMQQRN